MEIHQLGAIDFTPSGGVVTSADMPYTPGGAVSPFGLPTGGGMITLPTDTPAGPSVGGGAAPELKEDKPAVGGEGGSTPPEVREQWEKENKKRKQRNMIALGIGGLVLAYLLLRKK